MEVFRSRLISIQFVNLLGEPLDALLKFLKHQILSLNELVSQKVQIVFLHIGKCLTLLTQEVLLDRPRKDLPSTFARPAKPDREGG